MAFVAKTLIVLLVCLVVGVGGALFVGHEMGFDGLFTPSPTALVAEDKANILRNGVTFGLVLFGVNALRIVMTKMAPRG